MTEFTSCIPVKTVSIRCTCKLPEEAWLPLTTPTVPIKSALADTYLDYVNNYLTVDKFAWDYNLDYADAVDLLHLGRKFHEGRASK